MNNQFYDVVDSSGNIVETAEQQRAEIETKNVPLERPKPKLSIGEIKKLRKQFMTNRVGRVQPCQHRLDLNRQPTHKNCESCWFAWFQNHGEICQQLDEMHTAHGDALIIQLQGIKFLHRWRQFMATLAQWKQVAEINNEKDRINN